MLPTELISATPVAAAVPCRKVAGIADRMPDGPDATRIALSWSNDNGNVAIPQKAPNAPQRMVEASSVPKADTGSKSIR